MKYIKITVSPRMSVEKGRGKAKKRTYSFKQSSVLLFLAIIVHIDNVLIMSVNNPAPGDSR